ncbi:multiple epidermal growth factor-like domains protein 10 [Saccostrea echinata]|uniref:multiple epidermal growth factor-like domains protein 10 n=1 Tax=Saccostrea echinata TaxID=191078 RepID=UPI002A7F5881|nr:multiple epidermal growth factor-like domains protein 10 [Saccostrea echinata]
MALRRLAWQKNAHLQSWGADKAVDGQYSNRVYTGNQCTISADKKQTATWRVDLQSVVCISYINIFYRTDNIPGCPVPGYYGQNCNQTCSENCQGKQCDAVTGNCVNGCTPGYQRPHCTYLNLALGKYAWQQNNWPNKPIAWGAAKAVDGQYSDRSSGGNQCTISADGKQTAEWRVDLQRLVSIRHINIFYRTDNAPSPGAFYNRFAGFFLFVSNTTSKEDGHLCFHKIQHVSGTPSENQTINCPVHGRYVIYYNERRQGVIYPSYYSTYAYNDLCELEVYGCPDRRHYGEYCDKLCPGNCHEQSCNITSGHCLGCKPGYKGPKCNQICDQQTYGLECSLSCGNCSDGETCHHVNGTCPRGCSEGMEGDRCQTACQRGSYGKDCSQNCSENCGVLGRCSKLTGECEGGCQPGWRGMRCDRECEKGMYGVNCNQWCGHCLNDTHCHHVTGTCLQGCFSGHKGELCNIECDGGMYGENCSQDCGHCVNDTQCHHINGTCSGGCSSGYKELLCIKKCDGGMYGDNCSQTCGHCLSDTQCHHISGTCSKGCSIGYNGALCQEDDVTDLLENVRRDVRRGGVGYDVIRFADNYIGVLIVTRPVVQTVSTGYVIMSQECVRCM